MVFLLPMTSLLIALTPGATAGTDVAYLAAGESRPLIRQAGSIAKYACTLAALRMENEGMISLDAPVHQLLPGYQGPSGDAFTLRRLLENRSGLEDAVIDALLSDPDLPRRSIPATEAANLFATTDAPEEPGESFDYVNSNWILVQAILEHAGGASISDILKSWVFERAGALNASVFIGDISGAGHAEVQGDYLPLPDFVSCAGGLAATPDDLAALVAYPFRSNDFDEMDRAQLTHVSTPHQAYTLGGRFQAVRDGEGRERLISWQTGNNGPWFAVALYDPVTDEAFAAMSNEGSDGPEAARAAWLEDKGLIVLERPSAP